MYADSAREMVELDPAALGEAGEEALVMPRERPAWPAECADYSPDLKLPIVDSLEQLQFVSFVILPYLFAKVPIIAFQREEIFGIASKKAPGNAMTLRWPS
jgi:hypothetical protein